MMTENKDANTNNEDLPQYNDDNQLKAEKRKFLDILKCQLSIILNNFMILKTVLKSLQVY